MSIDTYILIHKDKDKDKDKSVHLAHILGPIFGLVSDDPKIVQNANYVYGPACHRIALLLPRVNIMQRNFLYVATMLTIICGYLFAKMLNFNRSKAKIAMKA